MLLGVATAAIGALSIALLWGAGVAERVRARRDEAHERIKATLGLVDATHALHLAALRGEGDVSGAAARCRRSIQVLAQLPGAPMPELEELRTAVDEVEVGGARAPEILDAKIGALQARIAEVVGDAEVLASALTLRTVATAKDLSRWIALLGILALVGCALSIVPRLERGLAVLNAGAARIQAGRFDKPIGLKGADELALLGATFDEMAAALVVAREELARRGSELEAARLQLGEAERLASIGRLTRGITHEVNNPLAIVNANLEYLVAELQEPSLAARREAAEEARTASTRIARIVRDLSAFALGAKDTRAASDINQVLRQLQALVQFELRGARLRLDLPEGAPLVRGSTATLVAIFSRLVSGAAAASSGVTGGEITIRVVRSADEVIAIVHDTGSPIAEEVLQHVFDPFYQSTPGFTVGDDGRGTGVGLSAVYGLTTSIGGRIRVESSAAAGTTFEIAMQPATSDTRLFAGSLEGKSKPRVLAISGQPLVLAAAYRLLQDEFSIVPHTNASNALALLAVGERFDAVVLDSDAAGTSFTEVLAALTALSPGLATGTVLLADPPGVPGPLRWVAKPVGAELLDTLRTVCGGASAAAQQGGPPSDNAP